MDYQFVREGKPERVALERWAWGVVYKDGTELRQFGEDGIFHQFKEIVQEQVAMFVMYRTDDESKRIDMPVHEGMQIFHLYRNLVLENSSRRVRVYVFGWKKTGVTVASYNYILPDDRLITTDRDIPHLSDFNI